MTWKIHWTRKNMVILIWRLPWVEWRTRVSSCLIPPYHHLGGRMFGQTPSAKKWRCEEKYVEVEIKLFAILIYMKVHTSKTSVGCLGWHYNGSHCTM